MDDLGKKIDEISRAAVLLVATDYDGTLAPIVSDPGKAVAPRETVVALKALAGMPQTHVAIISGRALADLAKHVHEAEDAHLVGSHGSEFEAGFATPIPAKSLELLKKIQERAKGIAAGIPGVMVEEKPSSVAFHYRNAEREKGAVGVVELLREASGYPGLHVRHGKEVVELSVVQTNKGNALTKLRQRLGATAVVFVGDDITDEDAFATLAGPDVGIKVGEGATGAAYRLGTSEDVARMLAGLAEKRGAWLAGSHAVAIEKHSMLSDLRSVAIVNPEGRVTWMCLPRIDSQAIFSELVGGPAAGYFEIRPVAKGLSATQEYVEASFVLRTKWDGIEVMDYLDCSAGRPFQRAGRTDLIRVISGKGRVRIAFAPRLDFGNLETHLRAAEGGVVVEGTVDPCVLFSPAVRWTIQSEGKHQTATAEVDLDGTPVVLEMRYGTGSLLASRVSEERRRKETQGLWNGWAGVLRIPEVSPKLVLRSAMVLRALVYGPTGAIAAAATTSLPEHAGGVRNWDYRFCWPRDAAMAAGALVRLGETEPAIRLLDWILEILESGESHALIHPVYSVTGGHLGPEAVIAELAGYLGSRPVRVGNMAAHQVQLDVLGPVAFLLSLLAQQGASLTPEHWRMTETMVGAVTKRWMEEDHGIWEIRDARRHHVHSKVMCWQTVDSALAVAGYMGYARPEWEKLREAIAEDVLTKGWNAEAKAFTRSYGSAEADAAALWVGLSGLIKADDPRFAATVGLVERELRDGATVYRYKYDDGLPGVEGGFNICTSWLIEAYGMLGRWKEAEELFEGYAGLAGPTGLMAEEYDPRVKMALGNFPQAYSHIGLINGAMRLAERREK